MTHGQVDGRGARRVRSGFAFALALLAWSAAGCTDAAHKGADGAVVQGDPWTAVQLVRPAELAAELKAPEASRPLLLHVGFQVLFRAGAIPGSHYVGAGQAAEGIAALKAAVQNEPRDKNVVLYCGCCPWDHCPNMRPAFATLSEMGFTHVRALYVPHNLQTDWVDAGFPVEAPSR